MTVLQYPRINGSKHSYVSIEMKLAGQIFIGFKSLNYKRTRERSMVYGTNTDPIAKTKGTNSYDADCEIYLAEFNQFQKQLQALGTGYGDQFFTVDVTYSTNGFDMIHDQILGCTLDSTEASNSQGNDALTRKFTLKPIKIIFNEIDDNDSPLVGTG